MPLRVVRCGELQRGSALELLHFQGPPIPPRESPSVHVAVGCTDDRRTLLCKFWVRERHTRAVHPPGGRVWTDSCVELFASHRGLAPGEYLNFECNAAGSLLAHRGVKGERAENAAAVCVVTEPSLGREPFGARENAEGEEWTMGLAIPAAALGLGEGELVSACGLRINAYKCGDELEVPHWVSLFPVATETPDFHRVDSFVELQFDT